MICLRSVSCFHPADMFRLVDGYPSAKTTSGRLEVLYNGKCTNHDISFQTAPGIANAVVYDAWVLRQKPFSICVWRLHIDDLGAGPMPGQAQIVPLTTDHALPLLMCRPMGHHHCPSGLLWCEGGQGCLQDAWPAL